MIAAIRQQHFIDQKVSKSRSLCAWLAMLLPGKPLPPFSFSRRHSSCALGAMIVNLRFGVASSLTPSHYSITGPTMLYTTVIFIFPRRSMGQERTRFFTHLYSVYPDCTGKKHDIHISTRFRFDPSRFSERCYPRPRQRNRQPSLSMT